MNFSQQVLADIKELHRLEGNAQTPGAERLSNHNTFQTIEELRGRIPTSILSHYDRLRMRGKQSVAPVCNNVCGACHLQISKGAILRLQGSGEMGVCDNCSAFIYVPCYREPLICRPRPKRKRTPQKSGERLPGMPSDRADGAPTNMKSPLNIIRNLKKLNRLRMIYRLTPTLLILRQLNVEKFALFYRRATGSTRPNTTIRQ